MAMKSIGEPELVQDISVKVERGEHPDVKDLAEALALVERYEMAGPDDMAFARAQIEEAAGQWRQLEDRRTAATKPLNAALREVNSWFKPAQEAVKKIEQAWKGKVVSAQLAAEAQARLLSQAAQELAKAGDMAGVKASMVAAADVTQIDTSGLSFRDVQRFEVVDARLVPVAYCSPDIRKIGEAIALGHEVPGVRVWTEREVRRTGR